MTYEEMADAFNEAFAQGFIPLTRAGILDQAECNSECERCPASEACTTLSRGDDGVADPALFHSRYTEHVKELVDGSSK